MPKKWNKLYKNENNGKSRLYTYLKIFTYLKKVRMCSVGAISL